MRIRLGVVLPLLVLLTVIAAPASADQTYVLGAPKWGAAQNKAVVAAGGVVTFSHAEAGLAIATSNNPDFLPTVLKSGGINSGAADRVLFQDPVKTFEINGTDELPPPDTFFSAIQWAPQAIEAPAAWAAGCVGQGVRVAIVDGGIHSTHIDLVANLDVAASRSFVPGFAFNQDVGTFWHGTHVAGIVAAADNGIGTIGIAPKATIIGVKVLHNGSGSLLGVYEGILYAATPIAEGGAGADIINLSLGTAAFKVKDDPGLISAFNAVLEYVHSQGVLVVAAAGNDSTNFAPGRPLTTQPADGVGVVTVSATGPKGFAEGKDDFRRVASYTNYGLGFIDLGAPGGDFVLRSKDTCTLLTGQGPVAAPCWVFDMVFSTVRGPSGNSAYGWAAGTSMAAPAVSAVAALIKGRYPNISLAELKARLAQTADDEGRPEYDKYYGYGFVSALNACIW